MLEFFSTILMAMMIYGAILLLIMAGRKEEGKVERVIFMALSFAMIVRVVASLPEYLSLFQ